MGNLMCGCGNRDATGKNPFAGTFGANDIAQRKDDPRDEQVYNIESTRFGQCSAESVRKLSLSCVSNGLSMASFVGAGDGGSVLRAPEDPLGGGHKYIKKTSKKKRSSKLKKKRTSSVA